MSCSEPITMDLLLYPVLHVLMELVFLKLDWTGELEILDSYNVQISQLGKL